MRENFSTDANNEFYSNRLDDDTDSVSTWQQFASSHGRGPVALVLHEGEASVLGFVGGAGVHDDVNDPFGDLPHLRQDLLALLGFGNPSHKQPAVVDAGTNTEEATVPAAMRKNEDILDELTFTSLFQS